MMSPIDMLQELLDQNQFEPLPETLHSDSIKLIYLMNDAVESFLVFHHAAITGTFLPDYEGEIQYDIYAAEKAGSDSGSNSDIDTNSDSTSHSGTDTRSHIVIRQGDSVCTIFYDSLDFEMHLYNYGRLGHFWVSGYEYLRQIEYRIAILRDKLDYIGADACTEEERKLALLTEFPPLNYNYYPSASMDYIVERENSMVPSAEAVDMVKELAREAGDRVMQAWLQLYGSHPNHMIAGRIAAMFHKKNHARLADLIDKKIRDASAVYPDRDLGPEMNGRREELLAKAEGAAAAHEAAGFLSRIVAEEPFTVSPDSIELNVYVMSFYNGFSNRTSHIQKIELP